MTLTCKGKILDGVDYTFEPMPGIFQIAPARSAGRLFTDIWRTGSGQSKRFGAPRR
jgi:hypothetical protein